MSKYLLIDGDSLAFYEMSKDTLEEGMAGIDSRIQHMLNITETDKYHLFLSTRSFRHALSKVRPYKGKRGKIDKILLPSLLKYLEVEHGGTRVNGLEADDLVTFFHTEDPDNSIVCSPDKDVLKQNTGTHYSYGKQEFVEVTSEEADKFLWVQTLMGDTTDNIEGIPGIGPKKAESILSKADPNTYYSAVLYEYITKFGYVEGIERFRETFDLVYLLKSSNDMIKRIGSVPTLGEGKEMNLSNIEDFM